VEASVPTVIIHFLFEANVKSWVPVVVSCCKDLHKIGCSSYTSSFQLLNVHLYSLELYGTIFEIQHDGCRPKGG